MENKINIAKLLKDCPQGMELDCILYDNIYFDTVGHNTIKCYIQNKGYRTSITFDFYGGLIDSIPTKCVIFPKGKTTWEGFQKPFEDGDIVTTSSGIHTFILRIAESNTRGYCYAGYDFGADGFFRAGVWNFERLATEEEKEKFFKVIKDKGYRWNAETKTLEKLVKPKFKVGDRIKDKNNKTWFVVQASDKHFDISLIPNAEGYFVPIEDQDDYELAPDKFDITTLVPFESRVLVRNRHNNVWEPAIFGVFYAKEHAFKFCIVGSRRFEECIPYEGNEHLLGTTDDCDEFYKIWK